MLFLFKLIVLSLIQGVGEILPISSSGHLIMISNLFKINDDGLCIEILLHFASLCALFFYYFDFIKNMIIKHLNGLMQIMQIKVFMFLKEKSEAQNSFSYLI